MMPGALKTLTIVYGGAASTNSTSLPSDGAPFEVDLTTTYGGAASIISTSLPSDSALFEVDLVFEEVDLVFEEVDLVFEVDMVVEVEIKGQSGSHSHPPSELSDLEPEVEINGLDAFEPEVDLNRFEALGAEVERNGLSDGGGED